LGLEKAGPQGQVTDHWLGLHKRIITKSEAGNPKSLAQTEKQSLML
jgi:hypothetical protein